MTHSPETRIFTLLQAHQEQTGWASHLVTGSSKTMTLEVSTSFLTVSDTGTVFPSLVRNLTTLPLRTDKFNLAKLSQSQGEDVIHQRYLHDAVSPVSGSNSSWSRAWLDLDPPAFSLRTTRDQSTFERYNVLLQSFRGHKLVH